MAIGFGVHAGAGWPERVPALYQLCEQVTEHAKQQPEAGVEALEVVAEATEEMENSGIVNAGVGSNPRLNSRIHMDASIMDSATGRSAAVIGIEDVRNPIRAALEVQRSSPHRILWGEGATLFAKKFGLAPHPGLSERAVTRLAEIRQQLLYGDASEEWAQIDWRTIWNYPESPEVLLRPCDTVGAVALDTFGTFASALSTGGGIFMLNGRAGDVGILGAGFYIWKGGAVISTGIGEEIIDREGARSVAWLIQQGVSPQEACERVVEQFVGDVGFVAITAEQIGIATNREMPSWSFMA